MRVNFISLLGYASWIGKYSEKDAVITQVLYACGAVPFVMTNVPQTLLVSSLRKTCIYLLTSVLVV